jgi:putative endonuclease
MKFFVYVIGSKNKSRRITYVGYTNNLQKRINLHNTNKGAKFTRGRNWKLLYHETFFTKSEAMKRESLIKKNKSLRKSFRDKI